MNSANGIGLLVSDISSTINNVRLFRRMTAFIFVEKSQAATNDKILVMLDKYGKKFP